MRVGCASGSFDLQSHVYTRLIVADKRSKQHFNEAIKQNALVGGMTNLYTLKRQGILKAF